MPHSSELTCLSYYALGGGVLTAIPAAATGILQANAVNQRERTIYEADGKTLKLVIKRLMSAYFCRYALTTTGTMNNPKSMVSYDPYPSSE